MKKIRKGRSASGLMHGYGSVLDLAGANLWKNVHQQVLPRLDGSAVTTDWLHIRADFGRSADLCRSQIDEAILEMIDRASADAMAMAIVEGLRQDSESRESGGEQLKLL